MSGGVSGAHGLERLLSRARRHALARAGERRAAIAARAETLPGVRAGIEGEAVILEGRGLLERWLRDAEIRDVGRDVGRHEP